FILPSFPTRRSSDLSCNRVPFPDTKTYESPAELPRCECGGRIRPHICWFGEMPFEMDRILRALDDCTLFLAIGTSGVVEPAASLDRKSTRLNSSHVK